MASAPVPTLPHHRRSFAGPVILILLGVIFLLGNAHVITWSSLGFWFAHYWPLLLILWGVIKLTEHMLASRQGYQASGIGFGGAFLICLIVVFGLTATILARVDWPRWHQHLADAGVDSSWVPWFGNQYKYSNEVEQTVASHGVFRLALQRGSITVLPSTDEKVHVVTHKTIVAYSKEEADRIDQLTLPQIKGDEISMPGIPDVKGLPPAERSRIQEEVARAKAEVARARSRVEAARAQAEKARADVERAREEIVRVNIDHPSGTYAVTDTELRVPPTLPLELSTEHGSIEVRSRQADVKLSALHGDVTVEDVVGNASITMRHGGDLSAHNIQGNVTVDGRINDTNISDVTGLVVLNGDSMGEATLQNLGQGLRFTTSRTDLQTGKIQGELRMDLHDLRASNVSGGFRVSTRSKQIHLEDVTGDIEVNNRNGNVELRAGKALGGNIVITNRDGGIEVTLPSHSAFQVEASTRGGEIRSDFDEIKRQDTAGDNVRANGSVGKGGKKIQLITEHADIDVRSTDQKSSEDKGQKSDKSDE